MERPEHTPSGRTAGRNRFEVVIFDVYRDGHRRDYFRVLRRVLGGTVAWGSFAKRWPLLLRARQVVCSTCDDYLPQFFLLAIARALMGRRTIGLSVRTETIFQRAGWPQFVKRVMLRTLKVFPKAELITFMPFWVEPRLSKYASDWMYDPQYWDLRWLDASRPDALAELKSRIATLANGRRVVATVGHQRQVKGVEYFMAIYSQPVVRQRFLFVCIGPNWDLDRALLQRFTAAGGVFVDRELRDDEVVPIYGLADLIWVCYRPDYDQSSGIFGRAIQLDRPTIVRERSYLSVLQSRLGKGGVVLPYARPEAAAAELDRSAKEGSLPLQRPIQSERTSTFLCRRLGIPERGYPRSAHRLGVEGVTAAHGARATESLRSSVQ